jgi:Helix-turn-helix domain
VLSHLGDGSINQNVAFERYGIRRLASRIDEIKKAGYPIKVERIAGNLASYSLAA